MATRKAPSSKASAQRAAPSQRDASSHAPSSSTPSAPQIRWYAHPGTMVPGCTALPALPAEDACATLGALRTLAHATQRKPRADWYGLVGPEGWAQTGWNAATLANAVQECAGTGEVDVCFCQAPAEVEALYHNPWLYAELTHPHCGTLARAVLDAAGLDGDSPDTVAHSACFVSGQVLVARAAFWPRFVAFLDDVLAQARSKLGKTARVALFDETPPPGHARYLDVLVTLLLIPFVEDATNGLRACKLALPAAEDNPHVRMLRELKDMAVTQQSRWATACWGNYRALYLAHTQGTAWIAQHRAILHPATLRMGHAPGRIRYVGLGLGNITALANSP